MYNFYHKLIQLSLCCLFVTSTQARQITDMAGRNVTIPDRITRVLPFDNKTNVLLFPIASDLMVGKARSMESPSLKYISKDFLSLKEFDPANAEAVLKLKPDLLIVGAIVDNPADVAAYVAFSKKIKIPLVIASLELMDLDKSYAFLGDLLDKKQEANIRTTFIRKLYEEIRQVKSGKHVAGKSYMANDNDGLRTAPEGSSHAQLFDVMGIQNAAKVRLDTKGFAQVSMEQILMWNPDRIFCVGKGVNSPYRSIQKSPLWRQITAIKNKHVYIVPSEPYLWFDMPPSINRLLGLVWFSQIFYGLPETTVQNYVLTFYRLFYQYNLTDKEYKSLFRWQ